MTIKRSEASQYRWRFNDDGEEEFLIEGAWINTYNIKWVD